MSLSRKEKQFEGFSQAGVGIFGLVETRQHVLKELPPGVYELVLDHQTHRIYFKAVDCTYDKLLDLPSQAYKEVMDRINQFLTGQAKAKFAELEQIYKQSALLYGLPGTGKTCIVNRVAEKVVAGGGIVIFNPDPTLLKEVLPILNDVQPEALTMVVLEELDAMMDSHESTLLHLLDGEVQKRNMMYLATTNYINRIPLRLIRPSRFASVVEVPFPDAEARLFYLNAKLGGKDYDLAKWAELTDGFSIDEVKDTVLSVYCLGQTLDQAINRMKNLKKMAAERKESLYGDDDEDDEERYHVIR